MPSCMCPSKLLHMGSLLMCLLHKHVCEHDVTCQAMGPTLDLPRLRNPSEGMNFAGGVDSAEIYTGAALSQGP